MKDYHKILIVSNMIPDKKHPSYGVFVKNFIEQMEHLHLPFDVSAMYMSDGKLSKLLGYIRFYMKTYKSILSGKYDLVYVHYPSFSFIPVNAARLVRRFDMLTPYSLLCCQTFRNLRIAMLLPNVPTTRPMAR